MLKNNNFIPKQSIAKIEEIRELEQPLTEAEIEKRIADSYNFELDSYSNIDSPKPYGPMYRAGASSSQKAKRSPKSNYYNFLCKCGYDNKFDSFSGFLTHIEDSHQIRNLNFPQILGQRNGSRWEIKFYWGLSCQCGHKFSSSLCNADLRISNKQIELVRKYRLQCLKCKNYAKFDKEGLLNKFLEERVKQKLIYSYYKRKFAQFENERDGEKELEGHKQELCEKCKSLGRYCGEQLPRFRK